jgi:hypothetical protein
MSRCVIAERRMVKAHFIFLVSPMLMSLFAFCNWKLYVQLHWCIDFKFTNWNFVRMLYTNQYLRIKRQISVCQYVVVPADKLLLTLFLFVENYYYGCLIKELFTRTLVIIPTKVLILTKKNYWQISIHSCCQWIFRLARSMVTSLLYIEYQNFTRIQTEKAILLVQVRALKLSRSCLEFFSVNIWLMLLREYALSHMIEIHSCCQWIFRLARSMVTSLLYIEYQNFTRIQTEKAILLVLLLVQQKNCL